MTDPDGVVFDDDTPEADVVEQLIPVDDSDEDTGLDVARVRISPDRDASEADLIDQAIAVPLREDDDR
jgi:hypothetical protein